MADEAAKKPLPAYDLDLDLVSPQPKTIKLGTNFYTIQPPTLFQSQQLDRFMAGLKSAVNEDEANKLIADLNDLFRALIAEPEFDLRNFNTYQVIALLKFVNQDMINPAENSELVRHGIEPNTEKKIPPVS